MAGSTTDYILQPTDGWVQVATSPGFLYIGAAIRNMPFFVGFGSSAPSDTSVIATGTLTFSGLPVDGETFVVGSTTYTFKDTLTASPNQIKIGADANATAANTSAGINAGAGSGTAYSAGTVANSQATATVATNVVTLHAILDGARGNTVVLTEAATNVAASGSGTLTGGTNVQRGAPVYCHFKVPEALTTNVYVRIYDIGSYENFRIGVVAD